VLTELKLRPLMRRVSSIHFIGGEKGGVGKSVVARLLCQYCIDRDLPFASIDADSSHGALLRYYGDYAQPVDLEQFDSADEIINRALGADRRVLVDLPAQSMRMLSRWLESADVLNFVREMGVELHFWHVTDGGFDSVNELERAFSKFGGAMKFVAVKNHGRSIDFSQFDESTVVERLRQAGGSVVELPALHAAAMYKIDRKGASFWAAAHSDDPTYGLLPMERQRTKLWLGQFYQSLAGVF
jgi:hypothetical protein